MDVSNLSMDSTLLARLEQLKLNTRNRVRGKMQGKRRAEQMGSSLDFADYRLYSPGDDVRQLDWNAYGRTGKPFIKLFLDEQELQVNLYIDCSKSMDFDNKFLYARQLAASIGYIALAGYDRVSTHFFSDQVNASLPPIRGKGSFHRFLQFISKEIPRNKGDISKAILNPGAIPKKPGVTWIFSDFLYETGIEETISYLSAAGQQVVVVQILSPIEIKPNLSGDLQLIDSESHLGKEVAMSAKVLKMYEKELNSYTESLKKYCFDHLTDYFLVNTEKTISETVFQSFRASGILQ
ncbi:DUF58 domain-containing protein [Chengkuizengella axinellae]|uniref:DUF58 domain-containing protein n=1 Tax=Chengkuizengella axinellae TaxID=3064388 RepID=A0ABT9IUW3_9BACL|nr:DUF58 domain-containing protein [Chengkuizengella sp. 2205SS18-9]MDP5273123.1 DUF58 domain-containing protein [Chengkuizengella sp. 2205SS18-9]